MTKRIRVRFLWSVAGVLMVVIAGRPLAGGWPVDAGGGYLLAQADSAAEEGELRKLRSDAQRERRAQRSERNQQLSDAARSFREEAGNLEQTYREQARAIDSEFRLEESRLQADIDTEVAQLESALQRELGARLMGEASEAGMVQRIKSAESDTRAHQDRVFAARKQGAARIQAARMQAELRKEDIFSEMDRRLLERAAALGLDTMPEAILATPIGGELTRQETQWNAREQKEVERLAQRNAKLLAAYSNGAALRAWERENLQEDFELDWQERTELQSLQAQQASFTQLLPQTAAGEAPDRQAYLDRLADNAEKQRLVRIRYEQIRKENVIRRRDEKRMLSAVPESL